MMIVKHISSVVTKDCISKQSTGLYQYNFMLSPRLCVFVSDTHTYRQITRPITSNYEYHMKKYRSEYYPLF